MRLAFVADGRSPIAQNWMRHFAQGEHEVHLISSMPCEPDFELDSLSLVPVAFGGAAGSRSAMTLRKAWSIPLRMLIRHWLGPMTVPSAARQLDQQLAKIRPDLVHAMRIPYEGMVAARAAYEGPLLLSVWGNDFTLHAPASPGMRALTRHAMARADALHADCERDLRLAVEWGFSEQKPRRSLPGNGGVRTDTFRLGKPRKIDHPALQEVAEFRASGGWVVVNPRGFRAYVRNDTFFKSIPIVQAKQSRTLFVCPSMHSEPRAIRWVRRLGIGDSVRLLPKLSRQEMAQLFQLAHVMTTPSTHDGTPNTLLEAMACGCLPVAGDLDSLREWIQPGENGLLVDPTNPASLAKGVTRALSDRELRERAEKMNQELIMQRAEYGKTMQRAESWYAELAS